MKALVEALCSDECAGRAPGTPGGDAARRVVRDAMRAAGLDPIEQRIPTGANVLATMERCGETIPGLKTAARAACHETVGIAKHKAGKLQDARREFERAVQLAPMNGGFHANYASALLNTGDRPAALQHATRAKALGITDHPIFGPLGMR